MVPFGTPPMTRPVVSPILIASCHETELVDNSPVPSVAPQLLLDTLTLDAFSFIASASLDNVWFCSRLYPTKVARGATPLPPNPFESREAAIPAHSVPCPEVVSAGSLVGSLLRLT